MLVSPVMFRSPTLEKYLSSARSSSAGMSAYRAPTPKVRTVSVEDSLRDSLSLNSSSPEALSNHRLGKFTDSRLDTRKASSFINSSGQKKVSTASGEEGPIVADPGQGTYRASVVKDYWMPSESSLGWLQRGVMAETVVISAALAEEDQQHDGPHQGHKADQ